MTLIRLLDIANDNVIFRVIRKDYGELFEKTVKDIRNDPDFYCGTDVLEIRPIDDRSIQVIIA